MADDIFHQFEDGVRRMVEPASDAVQKFQRDRRISKALDEALSLHRDGKYPESARVYEQMAEEYLQGNQLIYQLYGHNAFREWLKAKDLDNAMHQAREVLRVLNDADWLRRSSNAVEDLSQMVGELYAAGYVSQAVAFSGEIKARLTGGGQVPAGDPVSTETVETRKIPSMCPNCGAALGASHGEAEIQCNYCGSYIRPG